MGYLVVIEEAEDGTFSAFVPDLPGCVTSGGTVEEVEVLIREAIRSHIESLRSYREAVPEPGAVACRVWVE